MRGKVVDGLVSLVSSAKVDVLKAVECCGYCEKVGITGICLRKRSRTSLFVKFCRKLSLPLHHIVVSLVIEYVIQYTVFKIAV